MSTDVVGVEGAVVIQRLAAYLADILGHLPEEEAEPLGAQKALRVHGTCLAGRVTLR